MQNSANTGEVSYTPLNLSREILKRANGLKAFCIFELILSIIGGLFVYRFFFIGVPVAIVGIIATARMNVTLMNVFTFIKLLALAVFALLFVDLLANHYGLINEPVFVILMVTFIIYQMLGIFFSVRLRRELLLGQTTQGGVVELNSINESHQPMTQMSHVPPHMPPHMAHYVTQDPHATAGVPGFPYPAQPYYPTAPPAMYMNQGYPTYNPYPTMVNPATAPQAVPVATYPSFTISDEETPQQPEPADKSLLNN